MLFSFLDKGVQVWVIFFFNFNWQMLLYEKKKEL